MSETRWLSVTLDSAQQTSNPITIVLCHGLTGDKIGPQKLLSDLSSHLTTRCQGVEIIRFDFCGAGLSSGDFFDTSLDSMCEEALWIASHRNSPILWMGISIGALVALMAAGKRGKKEKVIAISNGFSESVHFTNIEEECVPLRGGQLFISKNYFKQRSLLYPRMNYFPEVGPITAILGSCDEKHFQEAHSLQSLGIKVHILEGGDHLFTEPEKRQELFSYLEGELYETV